MMSRVAAVNSLKSLAATAAGFLALLVAVAAIGIGIEYVSSVLEVELPFRQLLPGRNWNALTMQRRFAWVIIAGCIAAAFANRRQGGSRLVENLRRTRVQDAWRMRAR